MSTLRYPIVLTIAGSDSGGGAGIQADLKTLSSLGIYAASAITAITAQNTRGIHLIESVSEAMLRAQIMSVLTDIRPDVIKIGMIGSLTSARTVVDCLKHYPTLPIVYDPVLAATDGSRLTAPEALQFIRHELFPLCTLITPNLPEATLLCDRSSTSFQAKDMQPLAAHLLRYGSRAILLKGGHLEGNAMTDLLLTDTGEHYQFTQERIQTHNLHGTGCTLSSAIAAFLARGNSLPDAVRQAKIYIGQAILTGRDGNIGQGNGPLNHFSDPEILRPFLYKD